MNRPSNISSYSIVGVLLLFALLTLASCEINSSDNGDLDNWWYLRQVETITTDASGNTVTTTEDYVAKKVFWGYIGNIMQTEGGGSYQYIEDGKTKTETCSKIFFRFEQQAGTLRIYEPRYNAKSSGDPLLDPTTEADKRRIEHSLPLQGIHLHQQPDGTLEETFTIEQLDGDHMVLLNEDGTLRLHFLSW